VKGGGGKETYKEKIQLQSKIVPKGTADANLSSTKKKRVILVPCLGILKMYTLFKRQRRRRIECSKPNVSFDFTISHSI
jgi:hypothetical protein